MTALRVSAGLLLSVCLAASSSQQNKSAQDDGVDDDVAGGLLGVVVKTGADSFVIRAEDMRVITLKIADSTVFFHGSRWAKPAQLRIGSPVSVTFTSDPDGILTAGEVEFRDRAPTLKVHEPVVAMLRDGVTDDPLIRKARDASRELFHVLPDFLCQQTTTRSYGGADHNWRQVDQVTAEVLYDNGHESYRDVKLNGKLTGHSIMDLPGSRSTGEFSSTLRALFDPETEALFRFQSDAVFVGYGTAIYQFAVSGDKSDWRITAGSQMIVTPYKGRIWIDRTSGNVVRIEMEAVDIPERFPFRRVEALVDYGPVILPAGRYFLPEKAENVSCNGPDSCSRNIIEFGSYHKYVGESSISFGVPGAKP